MGAARGSASEEQVGDVGAGDEENEAADGEEDVEGVGVVLFHGGDADAGGDNTDVLFGEIGLDAGHPVGGHAAVIHEPLTEERGHARTGGVDGGAGAQTADDAEPCLEAVDHGVGSEEDGLLIDGDPEVGGIAAEGFSEEAGRSDADDGDGVVADDEGGTDDAGVGAVLLLPGAVAEHGDGRGVGLIVRGRDGAAGECAEAEGGEVIAADHFFAEGLGNAVGLAAAHAEGISAGLEGGERGELGSVLLHALIEGIREEAPVVLSAALDAAVGAYADAIEARGVDDGQRLEHDRVNEGEDGGGGADAEGQSEHGGEGEDRGQAHLAESVGNILAKGLHGVSL